VGLLQEAKVRRLEKSLEAAWIRQDHVAENDAVQQLAGLSTPGAGELLKRVLRITGNDDARSTARDGLLAYMAADEVRSEALLAAADKASLVSQKSAAGAAEAMAAAQMVGEQTDADDALRAAAISSLCITGVMGELTRVCGLPETEGEVRAAAEQAAEAAAMEATPSGASSSEAEEIAAETSRALEFASPIKKAACEAYREAVLRAREQPVAAEERSLDSLSSLLEWTGGTCDVCGALSSSGSRVGATVFRSYVHAGYNPFETGRGDLAGYSALGYGKAEAYESWKNVVDLDTSDWGLCPLCVADLTEFAESKASSAKPE
jgi:hypothetical protein